MDREQPLKALFFETEQENQPCREFLQGLSKEDRKEVGSDIFSVQNGFPLGLPLCRKLTDALWEVRSKITDGICRVIFAVEGNEMILLHGFIKKTQKTPPKEIKTAEQRLKEYRGKQK